MERPNTLNPTNVGDGTLIERIADGLRAAERSVYDKQTKASAKRQVVATITLEADDERDFIWHEIDVKVKLPGETPGLGKANIQIDADTGEYYAAVVPPKAGAAADVAGQQTLPGVSVAPPVREPRLVPKSIAANE